MITRCELNDLNTIYEIINDAASAYQGIIPADRWHDPYMPKEELLKQIEEGVEFWKYTEDNQVRAVMGIQPKGEVTLIRHAYTRSSERNKGIGSLLLKYLLTKTSTPVLIGAWADAKWAIRFYEKHGFRLVTQEQTRLLQKKYWNIPDRQIETSVVLASDDWNAG